MKFEGWEIQQGQGLYDVELCEFVIAWKYKNVIWSVVRMTMDSSACD